MRKPLILRMNKCMYAMYIQRVQISCLHRKVVWIYHGEECLIFNYLDKWCSLKWKLVYKINA